LIVSNRSSQSGLPRSINSIFHAHRHFFIALSRAMASSIVGAYSA
jgi:hypothetical protein